VSAARLPAAATALAVACGLLGFLASLELYLLPPFPAPLVWLAHPLLAAFGAAAGAAAVARGREIDRARWEVADEPLATSGERELAHKEAERQRRLAGTALLAAPVFVGYWLLYQVPAAGLAAWLLPATALVGWAVGYGVANRRAVPERRF
jgi:hypothetical protein